MQKRWFTLNVFILVVILIILVWAVWNFVPENTVEDLDECIDVNNVASFVYDVCFDAYSKNIFLEVDRGFDTYSVNSLEISFFDFIDRDYKLSDVPGNQDSRAYKIASEKNPQNLYVSLDIVKDFSAPICESPRSIFVRYCPTGNQGSGFNATLSPIVGVDIDDFVEIGKAVGFDSDIFNLNLVEKERIWKNRCESRWKCSEWEACENGVQNRDCEDIEDCFIPTGVPDTTRSCDGTCAERWECEWSKCSGGFTVPSCKDLNNCGTIYNIPQKLSCGDNKQCIPDIECDDWSTCEVDYNFMDLVGKGINQLAGSKFRTCVDKNGCVDPQQDVTDCSIGVDIYTKRFTKCGENFVGVYNRLDNNLIARISEGGFDAPYLNINLDGGDSVYCDYCFDGRISGDEEGVDCGGSCESCEEKYKGVDFKKRTFWNRFIDWVKRMLV